MSVHFRSLPILFCLPALTACSHLNPFHSQLFHRHHPQAGPTGPRFIGTVSLVNEEAHFALIDAVETPAPGTALKSVSPDGAETGTLAAGPEQKRPFFTADIVKGAPHRGDHILQ